MWCVALGIDGRSAFMCVVELEGPTSTHVLGLLSPQRISNLWWCEAFGLACVVELVAVINRFASRDSHSGIPSIVA